MTGARHRNKTGSPDAHSQPPAAATNDVVKKNQKSNKGAPPAPAASGGLLHRLCTIVLYVLLLAGAAGIGGLLYSLLQEVSLITGRLQHLSEQKGELAQTVNTLQKQVDILQKTVGRVEFISKDIQEKQLGHDMSIKNSEKELDVVGVILKKLQKDLSNVMQDVKDQGDRDLLLFDKTMKEKFTELNNSINEDIAELTEVQRSSQEEINNVKAKMASLGEGDSVSGELQKLKEHFSELQASFKSKEESIDWLMKNALEVDVVTANTNELSTLRSEHDILKRDVAEYLATVAELKDKAVGSDQSSTQAELSRVLKEFEQLSTSVKELENNYVSTNNDLIKEFENARDKFHLRLTPLEGALQTLNSEKSSLESLKTAFEDYSRRLNAVEETFAGLKHGTASGSAADTDILSRLKAAQETLSQQVEELKTTISDNPNTTPELEKLQVEVTSVLEGHKQQIEDLKYDYDQWKSTLGSTGSSTQVPNVDGLKTSITKLETDFTRMREAVDSLVAYSVKIETHDKDLESVKGSIEDLKESTDKLLVKFEHLHESV